MINVLHAPDLRKNLFSTKQLDQVGGEIIIKLNICILIF
jgi:Fe2+ transport system protein B